MLEMDMNDMAEGVAEHQGSSDEESSQQESDEASVLSGDSDNGVDSSSDDDDEEESEDEEVGPALFAHQIIDTLENSSWPDRWHESHLWIDESIAPHIFAAIDRFCPAVRGNTRVRSIFLCIPDIFVQPESLAKFGEVLATLVALQELELKCTGVFGMTAAAEIVRHTRQIRTLALLETPGPDPGVDRELHSHRLAYALRHHPALEVIQVMSLSLGEICRLMAVLPTLSSSLSHLLRVASLREVTLENWSISDSGLHVIAEGLCTGPSLSMLTFVHCQFPKEGGSSLASALKRNTTLKHLLFDSCAPDSTFFSALKDGLSTNTTLNWMRINKQLSEQERADLVSAVQTNYGLERVCTYGGGIVNSNPKSLLVCIPRLNRAGRCYLTDDPTSRVLGVAVLEKINYDLDCLFLHLQENPLLCMRQRRCHKTVRGRKRKADELR